MAIYLKTPCVAGTIADPYVPVDGTMDVVGNLNVAKIIDAEMFRARRYSLGEVSEDTGVSLWLENPTEATPGAQQYSPLILLEGQGCPDSGSSQEVQFGLQTAPLDSSTIVDGRLNILYNFNDSGWSNLWFFGENTAGPSVRSDYLDLSGGQSDAMLCSDDVGELNVYLNETEEWQFSAAGNLVAVNRGNGLDLSGDGGELIYSSGDGRLDIAVGGGIHLSVTTSGVQVGNGSLFLQERADAVDNLSGYGQIWVKNDQTLWFTDSSGSDTQLGTGGNPLSVKDEGVEREPATTSIDFVGGGVYVTASGTNGVRVQIDAGGVPGAHASTHQDGAGDEISVAGLSGLLADPQVPTTHSGSHMLGGGDEISVDGLYGLLADPQTPLSHASSHEYGGGDVITVSGLSGLLADPQTPLAHALAGDEHTSSTLAELNVKISDATLIDTNDPRLSDARTPTTHSGSHMSGGGDEISVDGLYGVLAEPQTPAAHDLDAHTAVTLAELNVVVSDATLIDTTDSRLSDARTPTTHSGSHMSGGGDEISVQGLYGLLADPQTPAAHALSEHTPTTLSGLNTALSNAYLADFGNVLAYGADPTGVADSRAAIQSALDAHIAVYIPAGTYRIDSGAISVSSGRRLFGESCLNTELFSEQVSDQLILINDAEQVQVSDLRLRRETATYFAYGNGIEITGTSNDIVVKHVRIWNCFNQMQIGTDQDADTVSDVLCTDVRVDHTDSTLLSSHFGFCLEWCSHVRLVDCSAKNMWYDGIKLRTYTQNVEIRGGEYAYNGHSTDENGDGLDGVGGGDTFTIIGGDYHHNGQGNAGYGINLKAASGDIGFDRNVTIIGPRCYSNWGPGLVINRASAGAPDNPLTNMVSVYGGFYYANGQGESPGCGVYVRGRNISLHGLMVRDNDEQGIDIQKECYDVNLHGVVCIANGTASSGTWTQLAIRGKRTSVFGGIFNSKNSDLLTEDADYASLPQVGGLAITVQSTAEDTLIDQPTILNPSLAKGIDVDPNAKRTVIHRTGIGSPEGVYEGGLGSSYTCTSGGGQNATFYVRETGLPHTKLGWKPHLSTLSGVAADLSTIAYSPTYYSEGDGGLSSHLTGIDTVLGTIPGDVSVKDEGVEVESATTAFDFVGDGVHTTSSGAGVVRVEILGGGTPDAHAATHQDGGGDELSVAGLSGLLADPQTPTTHSGTHMSGGEDEISVQGLYGVLAEPQTPAAHDLDAHNAVTLSELNAVVSDATLIDTNDSRLSDARTPTTHSGTHMSGGNDEISVAGLYGLLAEPQTPAAHDLDAHNAVTLSELNAVVSDATLIDTNDARLSDAREPTTHSGSHMSGGGDEISVQGLYGLLADAQTPLSHASSHITSGGDEIDGDKLDIDWTPSNYTPTTDPAEVDDADHLTAHLAGIDNALGSVGTDLSVKDEGVEVESATASIDFVGPGVFVTASGSNGVRVEVLGGGTPDTHAGTHLSGQSDEIDGDNLDIDYTPSSYSVGDAYLASHLGGIDSVLGVLDATTSSGVGSGDLTDNAIIIGDGGGRSIAASALSIDGSTVTAGRGWTLDVSGDGGEYVKSAGDNQINFYVGTAEAFRVGLNINAYNKLLVQDDMRVYSNKRLFLGNTDNSAIRFDTAQTVDALAIIPDSVSNYVLLFEYGDMGYDFGHTAQADPTLYIHSANQSTTEWLGLTHDRVNGVLSTGAGNIVLSPAGNVTVSGSLYVDDSQIGPLSISDEGVEQESNALSLDFVGDGVHVVASGTKGVRVEIAGAGAPDAHATTHQNGGGDEISVTGLSGLLADPQVPTTHSGSHMSGGPDEISVGGLYGLLAEPQTPAAHALDDHTAVTLSELNAVVSDATLIDTTDSRLSDAREPTTHSGTHMSGGGDEISVQGLYGVLAEPQTPAAHALDEHASVTLSELNAVVSDATLIDTGDSRLSDARTPTTHSGSHMSGGGDEISVQGLYGVLAEPQTPAAHDLDAHTAVTLSELNAVVSDATLIDTTDSRLSDARTPTTHSGTHMSGGDDEISVDGLYGLLADPQTPAAHALDDHTAVTLSELNAVVSDATLIDTADSRLSDARTPTTHSGSHMAGGEDEISVAGLYGVLAEPQTPAAHDLDNHNSVTLSELNAVVSDATLIDTADSRLSDARTPTSHATSHQSGGSDVLAGASLAVDLSVSNYTPTDTTVSGHLTGVDVALGTVTSSGVSSGALVDSAVLVGDGGGRSVRASTWKIDSNDDLVVGTRGDKIDVSGDGGEYITSNSDGKINFYAGADEGARIDGNGLLIPDNRYLKLGEGSTDPVFIWATGQTPDTLLLGLGDASRSFVICESPDLYTDFSHPLQANPTLFIQSSNASVVSQWLSFVHNQTDGVIETGAGNLSLLPAGGSVNVSGTLNVGSNTVTGDRGWKLDLSGDVGEYLSSSGDGSLELYRAGAAALTIESYATWSMVVRMNSDKGLQFGSGGSAVLEWDTAQTNDAMIFGLGASNTVILIEKGDAGTDYGHANQTNPTLFVQSADSTQVDQWISLAHDQSSGLLKTGAGDIVLAPAANAVISGTLFLEEKTGAAADKVGCGQVWAKDDQTLWFTDSGGAAYELTPSLAVQDEGVEIEAATAFIDFVGEGVTATASGTNGVRVVIPGAGAPSAHASSHLSGQSDEIDGDTLDIDYSPSNYTAGDPYLATHLGGIDSELGTLSTVTSSGVSSGNLTDNAVLVGDGGGRSIAASALSVGGTTLTAARGWKLDIGGDGVGSEAEYLYSSADGRIDFYIGGNPAAYLTTNTLYLYTALLIRDSENLTLGTGSDVQIDWSASQTNHGLVCGLGASNYTVICENADKNFNFAHGNETNPTLFIHSANQSTTEWIGLAHNQVDGVLSTGAGNLTLNPAGGDVNVSGTLRSFGNKLDLSSIGDDHEYISQHSDSGVIIYAGGQQWMGLWEGSGNAEFWVGSDTGNTTLYIGESSEEAAYDAAGFGQLWVKNTSPNELWFTDDEGNNWNLTASGTSSLDEAYNLGTTITVDAGPVVLDADTADTTAALSITREPGSSAAAAGLSITMGANATGSAIDVTPGGSAAALRVNGGKIDVSIGGDNGEYITSIADNYLDFYASGALQARVKAGGLLLQDSKYLALGSSSDTLFLWSTNCTPDATVLALGSDSRALVVCEAADFAYDWAHAQQTNPAVFIHSANQTATEWVGLAHDQTDGVISTGAGSLVVSPASGELRVDGDVVLSGTQTITGDRGWKVDLSGDDGEYITSDADNQINFYAVTGSQRFSIGSTIWAYCYTGITDNQRARFGTSGDAGIEWDTKQTNDGWLFGMGASNYMLLTEYADMGTDYGHANQTNPTLFIQSADDTNVAQWISFAHNQADGAISTGAGALIIDPAGGELRVDGDVVLSGTQTITGDRGWKLDLGGNGVGSEAEYLVSTADNQVDVYAAGQRVFEFSNAGNLSRKTMRLLDNTFFAFGTDSDCRLIYSTAQTPNSLVYGLPAASNAIIYCQNADYAFDFAHPQEPDPTVFVHSANQSATEWVGITHNRTDGEITTGAGALIVDPAGGELRVDGNVVLSGTQTITGGRGWKLDLGGDGVGSEAEYIYSPADKQIDIMSDGSSAILCGLNITVSKKATFTDFIDCQDNLGVRFGSSDDSIMRWATSQTNHGVQVGVGDTSNYLLVCQMADIGYNFAHANQTDPTIFIHSASQSATQWLGLVHDQTDGVLSTGAGKIKLSPAGDLHFSVHGEGVDIYDGALYIQEQAAKEAAYAGYGQLWVKNTTPNELWFTDDADNDWNLTASGTSSLDDAYNLGSTITVDNGAVVLDADTADTTAALSITREPGSEAAAVGLSITMGANATGVALNAVPSAGDAPVARFNHGKIFTDDGTDCFLHSGDETSIYFQEGTFETGSYVGLWNGELWIENMRAGGKTPIYLIDGPSAATSYSGYGQIWIQDATTTTSGLCFTDDSGNTCVAINNVATRLGGRMLDLSIAGDGGEYIRSDSDGWIALVADAGGANLPWFAFGAGAGGGEFFMGSDSGKTCLYLQQSTGEQGSGPLYGQIWVKNDDPCTLWFTDDTGGNHQITTAGTGIGGSLDNAYNNGATVTVDSGPITLNQSGSTNGLVVSQTGQGAAFVGLLGTSTANQAINVTEDNVARSWGMAYFQRQANATGDIISIDNDATATSRSIYIDHEGTGTGIHMDHAGVGNGLEINKNTGAGYGAVITQNAVGNGLNIVLQKEDAAVNGLYVYDGTSYDRQYAMVNLERAAAATGHVLLINNDATATSRSINIDHEGTGEGIYVDYAGSADAIQVYLTGANTASEGLVIWEDESAVRTAALVRLVRNHVDSTGHVIDIDNDATATSRSINIDHEGTGDAVYIDHAGTDGSGLYINMGGSTTDHGIYCMQYGSGSVVNAWHGGSGSAFTSWLEGTTPTSHLSCLESNHNHTASMIALTRAASATGNCITIDNNATSTAKGLLISHASTDSCAVEIVRDGNANSVASIVLWESDVNHTGDIIWMQRAANATGHCISIDNNAAATSNSILIDHEGTAEGIYVDHSGVSTAAALSILRAPGSAAAAPGIFVNVGVNSSGSALDILTYGTGHGISIVSDRGNTGGFACLKCYNAGAGVDNYAFFIQESTSVNRVYPMVYLQRSGDATGVVLEITPGGSAAAVRVNGGKVDLSIAGDAGEYLYSAADGEVNAVAAGAEHFTVATDGTYTKAGAHYIQEQAAAEGNHAGYSQLWVESTAPSTLHVADDAGNDCVTVNSTGVAVPDDRQVILGGSSDAAFEWDTNQTNDGLLLGLGASNYMVICEKADMGYNFAHNNQTHPALMIHSENQSTSEYICIFHSGAESVIQSVSGTLALSTALNVRIPDGDLLVQSGGVHLSDGAAGAAPEALSITGGVVATDCSKANVFTLALSESAVMSAPTNAVAGYSYTWLISSSGAYTLDWSNAVFIFPGGTEPTMTSSGKDAVSAIYDGTSFWCVGAGTQAFS